MATDLIQAIVNVCFLGHGVGAFDLTHNQFAIGYLLIESRRWRSGCVIHPQTFHAP